MIKEEILISWIKPASYTEENRCNSTIANIENCIQKYNFGLLKQPKIKLRGSYKNNTNVKNDSDVDMYALFDGFCYNCNQNFEIISAISNRGPTYREFKDAVYNCLQQEYGTDSIVRGNKSLKIKNNTYRVNADVVPVVNLYYNGFYNNFCGVAFYSNDNKFIVNFPEQDYSNGCEKNKKTNSYYKHYVRIFKKFRNELENMKLLTIKMPSYVLESLLYNVPNDYFMSENYTLGIKYMVNFLYNKIENANFCEVNGIKYMFRKDLFPEQTVTRENIKTFLWYINNLVLEEAV